MGYLTLNSQKARILTRNIVKTFRYRLITSSVTIESTLTCC